MDHKELEEKSEMDFPTKESRPVSDLPRTVPGQHPCDELYDMSHKNRGIALIFNQQHFNSMYMPERKGTEFDRDAMVFILKKLKFHVEVFEDLTRSEVLEKLMIVSKMDHTHNDCLLITVLSHGRSHGRIFARDHDYTVQEMTGHFSSDKCPSLAGKPKLFFIQACKGEKLDPGVSIKYDRYETDSLDENESIVYSIPIMADMLIMFSTVEDYF